MTSDTSDPLDPSDLHDPPGPSGSQDPSRSEDPSDPEDPDNPNTPSVPIDPDQPVHVPIDGVLDLHMFRPSELGSLLDEYIDACLERGIHEIRIVHGKGTGTLRRSVHHLLERNPYVTSYSLAGDRSGWGATLATLNPEPEQKQP